VNERASVELARRLQRPAKGAGLDSAHVGAALIRLEQDESVHGTLAAAMLQRMEASVSSEVPALRLLQDPPASALLREVLTGLVICETISAMRFAFVLRATDLEVPRA